MKSLKIIKKKSPSPTCLSLSHGLSLPFIAKLLESMFGIHCAGLISAPPAYAEFVASGTDIPRPTGMGFPNLISHYLYQKHFSLSVISLTVIFNVVGRYVFLEDPSSGIPNTIFLLLFLYHPIDD